MDSKEYWKKREIENLVKNLKSEEVYAKTLQGYYDYIMDQAQKEINGFYVKYATKEGITMAEVRRMQSGNVTHNHPSNASFSMADWKTFKNANLSEIRVATNDGTYYLRRKTKGAEWKISDEELEKEYKKIRRDVKSRYQDMYKHGMIDKTERFILSSDEYNRLFAEKNGFEYGKEMYDE